MDIGDVFGDLIAEADARDAERANEHALEVALAVNVHSMHAVLRRVVYADNDADMRSAIDAAANLLNSIEELAND